MSLRALTWAWDQPTQNSGTKLVLLALADHANDDLTCFPAIETIANKTGLSQRTVREYLDDLADVEVISKVQRRRRENGTLGTWLYRLNRDHTSGDGSPVATDRQRRQVRSTTGDGSARPVATGQRAEPSCEPSCEPSPLPPVPTRSPRSDDLAEIAEAEDPEEELTVYDQPLPITDLQVLTTAHPSMPSTPTFAVFWSVWPHKIGRKAAERAWRTATKDTPPAEILAGLERLRHELVEQNARGFCPHPTTWLNAGRWDDDLSNARRPSTPGRPSVLAMVRDAEHRDASNLDARDALRALRELGA